MRLAGKRFWTWISVAVLSVFVKGGTGALAQEKTETGSQSSTTEFNHKVPPGPHSKITTLAKDKDHKISSASSTSTGKVFPKMQSGAGGANASSGLKTSSRLKTSTGRAGGDDTPTESATKSKHHGLKKPK